MNPDWLVEFSRLYSTPARFSKRGTNGTSSTKRPLRVRNPLRPPRKKNLIDGLEKWTNANVYQNVQNRLHASSQATGDNVNTTMRNLALYMEKYALRAPQRPHGWDYHPQHTLENWHISWVGSRKYLYRGVHGVQANTVRTYGSVLSKGYIATSRYLDISKGFAKFNQPTVSTRNTNAYVDHGGDGVLFRLSMDDIPRGTPWIWFNVKNDQSLFPWRLKRKPLSQLDEGEVLLPPGSIFVFPSMWTEETIQTTIDAAKTIERVERPVAPETVDKVTLHIRKETCGEMTASFGNIYASISGIVGAQRTLRTVQLYIRRGHNMKNVKQATLDVLAILEKVRKACKIDRIVITNPNHPIPLFYRNGYSTADMHQINIVLGHLIQSRPEMFGNLMFSGDIVSRSASKSIYVPLKMPASPAKRTNSNWNVPFSVFNNDANEKIRALKSVGRNKRPMARQPLAAKKRKSTASF